MDRITPKQTFTLSQIPEWICPSCFKGVLRIEKGSFRKDEAKESRDHSHEAWEPDWIQYVYSCLLRCSNENCQEIVSSSGVGSVDAYDYLDDQENWVQETVDKFHPRYFEPHLKLITIHPNCPDSIVNPLNESFKLFFCSPSSALNSVRASVEALLDTLKIKRYNVSDGKRRIISLHQRILLLPPKYKELKDHIMAIKWLGNAGSHRTSEVSSDDVLNAIELMEHVIDQIYSNKKVLTKLAKKVNKHKGPHK